MEVFQHTFTQMLMLFAIMLCGFIARKKRMTDDLFDGNLSKLVMSITLPATILNSVLSDSQLPPDEVILTMFGYAALYFLFATVFSYAVAHLVYRKLNRPARGAHAFMMMFGNVGFLGFEYLLPYSMTTLCCMRRYSTSSSTWCCFRSVCSSSRATMNKRGKSAV